MKLERRIAFPFFMGWVKLFKTKIKPQNPIVVYVLVPYNDLNSYAFWYFSLPFAKVLLLAVARDHFSISFSFETQSRRGFSLYSSCPPLK